jgi:hypothetical protein
MNNPSLETFIPDRYGKGLPFQVLVCYFQLSYMVMGNEMMIGKQ